MDDERMTDADVTLAQIRAYLAAHDWTRQSDPDFPSDDVWRHPGYGDYPDDGILLPDRDGAEVLERIYTAGVLESLARFEVRCEHEVLADMLGEIDMATVLAENERLRDENGDLRSVIADEHSRLSQEFEREAERKALLVGVECVLLDHAAELSGPLVDPNLAELAYRFLAVVGNAAPARIRDALDTVEKLAALCERCGGVPCSTCGECPRQGCWDCRCAQQDRDDDGQDGGDDG